MKTVVDLRTNMVLAVVNDDEDITTYMKYMSDNDNDGYEGMEWDYD